MSGILASIGFATPWLLWALLPLPVIWWLLRAIPPAPVLRRFPGVILLLGLQDEDSAVARTPLWLLLLRLLALVAAIVGFAGPALNPGKLPLGSGPLLILADADWADAGDWQDKRQRMVDVTEQARRAGRTMAFASLTGAPAKAITFTAGDDVATALAALEPNAWEAVPADFAALAAALPQGAFETVWFSDGLERAGRAGLVAALQAHGKLTVQESPRPVLALGQAAIRDGKLVTRVMRPAVGNPVKTEILAIGLDPSGVERELARQAVALAGNQTQAEVTLDLPAELRNRLTRLELAGAQSAGAVSLADDALRRRKVALIEGGSGTQEGLDILSPLHFLRQALLPTTDLIEGALDELLPAAPEVIILADVARLQPDEADRLADWVDEGGLLVRFAGPRLAASVSFDRPADPLLPVILRPGDRSVGGTMSWGVPRKLAPFPNGSPFHGLAIPADVEVTTQVLAEPSPDLADHTIAALDDGTPLVTRTKLGDGQVVLFHITANAEWSNLPLSGLFVDMLDRLAISSRPNHRDDAALAGTVWKPVRVMDAFGQLHKSDAGAGVAGEKLAKDPLGPNMPPGLYAADDRHVSLNVIRDGRSLEAAVWPAGVQVLGLAAPAETPLKGALLAAALTLLLVDILATLIVSGRLQPVRRAASVLVVVLAALALAPSDVRAQDQSPQERLAAEANGMELAYVLTGNAEQDALSRAGLTGLVATLAARTSVEPGAPIAVDLDHDELSVLAFLYWPVSTDMPAPSPEAYRKLNRFLHSGGLILFDTRDGDLAADGSQTAEAQRLQELAAPLDIPPLETVPADHVLTRSFYLLDDFPGRYDGTPVWVEAAPADAEQAEGMPFRNLNDGVTPVVIGGNDWAAAWAIDAAGNPLYPVGRGVAGERQREMAYRFGVNLVMHVLTGNYKSDQVHVPALLERLGQ